MASLYGPFKGPLRRRACALFPEIGHQSRVDMIWPFIACNLRHTNVVVVASEWSETREQSRE